MCEKFVIPAKAEIQGCFSKSSALRDLSTASLSSAPFVVSVEQFYLNSWDEAKKFILNFRF